MVGLGLEVWPWERRLLRAFDDDDISTVAATMSRANGKTTGLAAVACAYVSGPMARAGGSVAVIAPVVSTAALTFDAALGFLGAENSRRYKVNRHHSRLWLLDKETGAELYALPARTASLQGHGKEDLIIIDEPAEFAENQRESVFQIITGGLGKNPRSTIVAIGIRPVREALEEREAEHFFERMLDGEADMILDYSNKPGAPLTLESARKSNPSFDHSKTLNKEVRSALSKARRFKTAERSYRAQRQNEGVLIATDELYDDLVSLDDWRELCEGGEQAEKTGVYSLGLDLGGNPRGLRRWHGSRRRDC